MSETRDYELRISTPSDDGDFEGVAVTFNRVDRYRTSFDQRAFDGVAQNVPLLWAHNRAEVVGSTRSITATPEGLKITGRLNLEVAKAREVRALLQAGDIRGLSIGFRRFKDEAHANGVRHITKAELGEISFVSNPAVPGSQVQSIRSSEAVAVAFTEACRNASAVLRGRK